MRELSNLQEKMLIDWVQGAEQNNHTIPEIVGLDQRLSALINSLEYEEKQIYFPRLINLK